MKAYEILKIFIELTRMAKQKEIQWDSVRQKKNDDVKLP